MNSVDINSFEFVMRQITDGFIFEEFAQNLLCHIQGKEFIPIGGIKDGGVDGMQHCFFLKEKQKYVYQISIQKDAKSKIKHTIKTLEKASYPTDKLIYVTNQIVKDKDKILDELFEEYPSIRRIDIYDLLWLRAHINTSSATIKIYLTFIESYCHEFLKTPKQIQISDFHSDPRIFVYLRHQWEAREEKFKLDELLADTLILYALEGTDPDKSILRTQEEIVEQISRHLNFSIHKIENIILDRLNVLSTKPRKINHHRQENAYCLPYETRLEVEQKLLNDASLDELFREKVLSKINKNLEKNNVSVKNAVDLIIKCFTTIFKDQGLEFSNFISNMDTASSIEKNLDDIISKVVDATSISRDKLQPLKQALLATIRQVIYDGSEEETEYLKRLSNTYTMLFLLQCDPKLAVYFSEMASKLKVLVGNSIIVPAISEYPLPIKNRRHWNLLKKAFQAGVTLYIDKVTLKELWSHIRSVINAYEESYKGREDIFSDEAYISYIDQILIRSYFYSQLNTTQEKSFEEFINCFVSPKSSDPERELFIWLNNEFGIKLLDEAKMDININKDDYSLLTDELQQHRESKSQEIARTDAKTILEIHALREKDAEMCSGGMHGYLTWWLTKDKATQRVVQKVLGKKYKTNVYMRADFLNNYISLAPNVNEINNAFDKLFPSLIGVSISHHIPQEVKKMLRFNLKEHADLPQSRIKAIMADIVDKLKTFDGVPDVHDISKFMNKKFEQK